MTSSLEEIPDPDKISLELDCLKIKQPIGDIYIASISFKRLIEITYFDVRRVIHEQRDVEKYLGIQRPLKNHKLADLKKYVNYFDASFPTAIILAIKPEFADYDKKKKVLTLSNVKKGETKPSIAIRHIARVLDGQHRIAGLSAYKGDEFDQPVTIFVGATIADQAQIFATVNLEQDKVSKNLVYDLTDLAKSPSPQKSSHHIAVGLDQNRESPLFGRIKRLGFATPGKNFEPISQANFVESLLEMISPDAKEDRDKLLRNQELEKADAKLLSRYPFRNLFIEKKDMRIAELLFDYFDTVKTIWPEAWKTRKKKQVLNRSNGFKALIRTYRVIYNKHGTPGGFPNKAYIEDYLRNSGLKDIHFNTTMFPPGSTGESRLFKVLTGEMSVDEAKALQKL